MWRSALRSILALASIPAIAAAQPIVHVRAETRIELRVSRQPEAVEVEGTLRDDRGEPLPDRAVELRMATPDGERTLGREVGRTDAAGRVSARFGLEPGSYHVSARFVGDESYDRVDVGQRVDLDKAHVRLGMSVDGAGRLDRLNLDEPEHRFRVRAESPEGGGGLPVALHNELDDVLASGTTGPDGTVVLSVRSEALGPPAAGRLKVHTEGDARRARAQTEVLVVRFRPTRLELSATPERIRAGEPLELTGRLSDSAGPIARKAVGLYAGDEHLATVLTGDDGRWRREIRLEGPDGPVPIHARFASDAPWRPAARSTPVRIALSSRGATPWWWLLVPMVLCGLLIAWLSRREAAEEPREEAGERAPSAPPGIVSGRPVARSAERRDVAGTVVDADGSFPLGGAVVALEAGERTRETRTDERGGFRFDEVPDGGWRLHVRAEGYEARQTDVAVPHRGQWSGLRVRLRSLREVALATYRPVAEALTPERRWWAHWTARELLSRARGPERRELQTLTELVERAVYGAAPPRDEDVREIERRSAHVATRIGADPEPIRGGRASDR
ncbi:MAG TPA: carboxypeptidase-like regulatory domain-containing protein [Sandaracinaceae bacterium LLY-WYZ-13_1]|nr:carboxypeptidase-like regulatory domain-containing protein [Sandaracinaceae bacterium LLY-WYZ-13_1]